MPSVPGSRGRGRAAARTAARRRRAAGGCGRRRRPFRRRPRAGEARATAGPEPRAAEPPPPARKRTPRGRRRPDWPDLIRALDFPRDAEDREGFQALKAALRHHGLAQMLQAAEDVLNLLSRSGSIWRIWRPEPGIPPPGGGSSPARAGPSGWDRGIDDPQALERGVSWMRTIRSFATPRLYFQRRFDLVLTEFGDGAGMRSSCRSRRPVRAAPSPCSPGSAAPSVDRRGRARERAGPRIGGSPLFDREPLTVPSAGEPPADQHADRRHRDADP